MAIVSLHFVGHICGVIEIGGGQQWRDDPIQSNPVFLNPVFSNTPL
jgi:hypothetical protein